MNAVWQITLIGLLAGVLGTSAGGTIALLLNNPRMQVVSFLLGFSGGIMLAVVLSDLLPEAIATGGFVWAMVGLLCGVGFITLLDLYLPHHHLFETGDENSNRFLRTGLILGLGIAMHNLPEGIAIGAGYVASPSLGLALALTIALHNVPEGIAMTNPLCAGGVRLCRVFLYTGLAGVPMGLGALVGATLGNISPLVLALALGLAGGAMLYIVFGELIPGAQESYPGLPGTFGAVLGVIAGALVLHLLH